LTTRRRWNSDFTITNVQNSRDEYPVKSGYGIAPHVVLGVSGFVKNIFLRKYLGVDSDLTLSVTNVSTTSTIGTDEAVILVDTSSGVVTLNLPAASSNDGRILFIKDEKGTAATNKITVDPNSSETIDGKTTLDIQINYGAVVIACDGSNWQLLTKV
tara:strand:+ start:1007 stop:1477 length:471 start_codon:yes stop_codon:yes gene_type:complete